MTLERTNDRVVESEKTKCVYVRNDCHGWMCKPPLFETDFDIWVLGLVKFMFVNWLCPLTQGK